MPITRSFSLFTLCLLIGSHGCGAVSKRPDPEWAKDFDKVDMIVLHRKGEAPISINDPVTIDRLRVIYNDSKWAPYWHTLPGNLGDQTIEIYDGNTKLRTFSYTGELWESESYTKNRTTELSDVDRQWIDSLFESD